MLSKLVLILHNSIKFSTGIATNYDTLEAGIGYRQARHRMDLRLGFMCDNNCRDNFIQGNYYYNIIKVTKHQFLLQVA
ncbi:putative ompA-like autotransporter [Orientia tsutsugamushi str. UT144]|uniref:Putative ompA-like autotransporter n=2 Tax=Orientia tsutsugamushi str. UT144 TaxID=1441384 RepID=A0A0F3RKC7_ORITS|nr:putative ompA-like autotransporter [Orientia tsutsugamushi str. UT144]